MPTKKEVRVIPLAQYLEEKHSPLATEASYLTTKKHWKLLVAISAIESQYCKRTIDLNCWNVGGDSNYRHYKTYREAIDDADDLITYWQSKGRWNTVEDMNGHYVVPKNDNWVRVVNDILLRMDKLEKQTNE